MNNSQRSIVKIIQEICAEEEITCDSFSYDWIFRLSKNGKTAHIFGYQFELNSSTAQLICADKSATSDLLSHNHIPVVQHTFFMSPTNLKYVGASGNWTRLMAMLAEHGKLVCKPNEGSGGENVYLVSNQFELEQAAYKIANNSRAMAVAPYYRVENEYRVVVLHSRVKLIYSKNIPFVQGDGTSTVGQLLISFLQEHTDYGLDLDLSEGDHSIVPDAGERFYLNWKHNLGQGATPVMVQDAKTIAALSELALRAAQTVGIEFASVDIIKTGDQYLVLEINSGIMMEFFSQMDARHYSIAKSIYQEAIRSMLQ